MQIQKFQSCKYCVCAFQGGTATTSSNSAQVTRGGVIIRDKRLALEEAEEWNQETSQPATCFFDSENTACYDDF